MVQNIHKKISTLFFAVLLSVSIGIEAFALSTSGTASVNIASAITVEQIDILNFGKVIRPASGNYNVTVKRNGDYNTASVSRAIGSDSEKGIFQVTGNPGSNFTLSVDSLASNITGVDLLDILIPNNSLTLNNQGKRNFSVGGRIKVYSTAATGTFNEELSYNLTVDYE